MCHWKVSSTVIGKIKLWEFHPCATIPPPQKKIVTFALVMNFEDCVFYMYWNFSIIAPIQIILKKNTMNH